VDADDDLLGEVLKPHISTTVRTSAEEGGGMLLLGRVMQNVWRERQSLGEPKVGGLWGLLDAKVKLCELS